MVQSQEDQVEEGEFLKFLLFCWKIKCESLFTVKIRKQAEHISNDDGRRIRHRELSYSSNLSEVMIKLWYILKGVGCCRLVCHVAGIGVNGISVNVFFFNHFHQVCGLLPPPPPLLPLQDAKEGRIDVAKNHSCFCSVHCHEPTKEHSKQTEEDDILFGVDYLNIWLNRQTCKAWKTYWVGGKFCARTSPARWQYSCE